MQTGAITGYIDVAQIVLYAFWIFFAGLILYLRREDKREGYPLESDVGDGIMSRGFLPAMPQPKIFKLLHGGTASAPNFKVDSREIRAVPVAAWPGAPLEPTGNPMVDGVGPAAYANRSDVPDLTIEGHPKIVPLRVATDFWVERRDPDPRGMAVVGADGKVAGIVSDVWVDRSEILIRYLEVDITEPAGGGVVLLPMPFARVDKRRGQVRVKAILAEQFIDVPKLRDPNLVTFLEEDRICAYYGGGMLYAEPSRLGPML
jgi:photosynthetic reaction center H subunit